MTQPRWRSEDGSTRLLVPVDGSEGSLRAVAQAIALAKALAQPARIVLLNVQVPLSGDIGLFIPAADLRRFHAEQGEKQLAGSIARLRESGLEWESHIVDGAAVESILQAAKEYGCQSIVISGRGVGGLRDLLLGSVAGRLLQVATLPVVLVP